ncbi:MAG: carboxylesterase family protein, partial [Alphaproteobacteria bacterium]|nr:carboxylesterase family protein [Alphaproteobacteria bacterium]
MTFIRRSAIAFLAFGLALGPSVQTAMAEPIRTQTASGILIGDATEGVASYKGVPYAAAPVGERRWAPPQPAASWEGEREALQFSPACMQASRNGP